MEKLVDKNIILWQTFDEDELKVLWFQKSVNQPFAWKVLFGKIVNWNTQQIVKALLTTEIPSLQSGLSTFKIDVIE